MKEFVFAVLLYLFVFVYGFGFIFNAAAFGLGGELWLFALLFSLPAVFLALYAGGAKSEKLARMRGVMKWLAIITLAIAVVVVSVFIVPISY